MKQILKIVASIVLTLFFVRCNNATLEEELRIDLGVNYDNDSVSIAIDDYEIFSGIVSTNHALGVGEIIVANHPTGRHKLTVDVNGTISSDNFRHKKGRFIYIEFDKATSKITISYPGEGYFYD